MKSIRTPSLLIRVERRDVHSVDTMIWQFINCNEVNFSSRGGVFDGAYGKTLGGALA